jgi:hypothetical protein
MRDEKRRVCGTVCGNRRDPPGRSPHDLLTLCARALAEATPTCCEAHQNELKAELRVLNDGVAILREQDAAEAAEGNDVHPPQVHWGRGHERSLRH